MPFSQSIVPSITLDSRNEAVRVESYCLRVRLTNPMWHKEHLDVGEHEAAASYLPKLRDRGITLDVKAVP